MWPVTILKSPSFAFAGTNNNNRVPPTEISEELKYEKYDDSTVFPVPKVENVYLAWKPVDHGHPLRDETLYYAPPSLERVRFAHAGGPQSRSIDDEVFHHPKGPIVIPAQRKIVAPNHGYSVYGSPHINYSALYHRPPVKLPTHSKPRPDGRENPYLAFQRDYLSSAANSRSADTREYPLNHGRYGQEEVSAFKKLDSHGGGLQMIKPPNRKKKRPTEYFYYSNDSPHYKDKMNKVPNIEENEASNEIISIDGIIVGTKDKLAEQEQRQLQQQQQQQQQSRYPPDLQTEASERRPVYPRPPPTKASVHVYSFKNTYGQKEQVGVIFDENSAPGPQVSKVFPSHKQQGYGREHGQYGQPRHDQPSDNQRYHNPRHQQQNHHGGPRTPANFIPLANKAAIKDHKQSFPLGNPFKSPLLSARPESFPALSYPPLYKTQPAKLEGSFGPALPPKPEPDVITFPGEERPGVQREVRREDPYHYYHHQQQQQQQQNQYYHHPQQQQQEDQYVVYKTVRDMDYSRPSKILNVKPSGELYLPDPDTLHAPMGDASPRVPVLPGHGTLEEWQQRQREEERQQEQEEEEVQGESALTQEELEQTEADDRLWLADFSDTFDSQTEDDEVIDDFPSTTLTLKKQTVPKLSDIFGAGINQPTDLATGSSIADEVVFRDDVPTKQGSGFKFPGKSTSDEEVKQRPPPKRAIIHHQKPQRVNVQKVQQPNYSVVIGLTYDDQGTDIVVKDYDEDFTSDEEEDEEDNFGKKELYDLCLQEVPKYLHRELCGYIKDGKIPPGREVTKDLQPRPSKLIQGASPPVLSGRFIENNVDTSYLPVEEPKHHDPFAGIPTELPVQINKDDRDGPRVITSHSKVKIYKPQGQAPTVEPTTTSAPVLFQTAPPTPRRRLEAYPTNRPSESPLTSPEGPPPGPHQRHRPLLFNKRDPNTGETMLSKPFEYFNRITQFFSNRVPTPQHNWQQQQHHPPPPRLIRHRITPPQT
jgi:hypothetical protein